MCNPAVAGLIISAVAAGASYYQADENADNQARAIEQQTRDANEQAADQATVELGERTREARQAASRRLVAAGEAGVAGASLEAAIGQDIGDANTASAIIDTQNTWNQRANANSARHAGLQISRPSWIEAGAGIANAGASGYSAGKRVDSALQIRRGNGSKV